MKSFKAGLIVLFALLLSVQSFSQGIKPVEKKSFLLDATKPAVYLEFVKTGKCTEDFGNFNFGNLCSSKDKDVVTYDAFWVRLVNNTSWAIGLTVDKGATEANSTPLMIKSTASVNEKGETSAIAMMMANNGAEMDVVYKAESETGCDFGEKAPPGEVCKRRETIIPEIPLPALSTSLFVASGESVIFPVDFKHIKKYVNLYVLYNFEWEYSGKNFRAAPQYDMQHRTYFGWFDLEKGIRQEEENKQKKNIAKAIK